MSSLRTHVVLDGLQEPIWGRELSRCWHEAGFDNAVDVSGQAAWLAPRTGGSDAPGGRCLTSAEIKQAAMIARAFGLEIRDRAGDAFRPDNDLAVLRDRTEKEYRRRLAVALMFGLPALALHYVGPYLAGDDSPRRMAFPWLFELLLVGWACVAAAWPMLWQGALSALYLRPSADAFTSLLIVVAFVPSAVGVIAMAFVETPWFSVSSPPMFYAVVGALWVCLLQRWLLHHFSSRLGGRATRMLSGHRHLVFAWLMMSLAIGLIGGWRLSLAFGLLLPPMLSLGAVNDWSPGWTMTLPVFAFAALFLGLPRSLPLSVDEVRIEIAIGFGLIMTMAFGAGWSAIRCIEMGRAWSRES